MSNGRHRLVVKPTVGIPLLLGTVAVGAFLVHSLLLTHTTWLRKSADGKPAVAAMADLPTSAAAAHSTVKLAARQ